MKRSVRSLDFLPTKSFCSTIRLLSLLIVGCAGVASAQTFGRGIGDTITDPFRLLATFRTRGLSTGSTKAPTNAPRILTAGGAYWAQEQ